MYMYIHEPCLNALQYTLLPWANVIGVEGEMMEKLWDICTENEINNNLIFSLCISPSIACNNNKENEQNLGRSNKFDIIHYPPFFFLFWLSSISLYCSGNRHLAAVWLTFQGGMARPHLNSWRPGGEPDAEGRSFASHWKGDREEGQTEGERERGEHWTRFRLTLKGPFKVSSAPVLTHMFTRLARWTSARSAAQHSHLSSLWTRTELRWCSSKSTLWWQAREGERVGGRGISIIRESECHWWHKVPLPTRSPLSTLTPTTFQPCSSFTLWFVILIH